MSVITEDCGKSINSQSILGFLDSIKEKYIEKNGMVQKNGILVNTMRDEFSPFWYALLVHMMFKNLGNLCDSFKSLKT
jgi:hypothetical protein